MAPPGRSYPRPPVPRPRSLRWSMTRPPDNWCSSVAYRTGDLGDTWTWNGTTWTQQYPTTSPPARDGASMAYDPGTGQLVLFGGDDASGGNLNDTWVYSPIDTVAFNSDGGAAVPSISGPDGSSITLPSDTYPGYVFNGWYTAASGGTKVGAAGASYTVPAGGITLFAQWTAVRPTVSGVSPNSGPTKGGTAITVTGTGFVSGAKVVIGQGYGVTPITATSVKVVSATKITAVTGGGAKAGTWNLFVSTSGGKSAASAANQFTYNLVNPVPTVTAVSPNSGPTKGGTAITVSGTGFVSGAKVVIGQGYGVKPIAATNVKVVSAPRSRPSQAGGPRPVRGICSSPPRAVRVRQTPATSSPITKHPPSRR